MFDARQTEMRKGTLDLLVLRTLSLGPLHGIAIADRIYQVTQGTFEIGPGSLFPALHRLEREGWIRGTWGVSERGRRAKSYVLTAAGRKQLVTERQEWSRIVTAVSRVLDAG
jgi:PadR family transcriptional regulator PadR